MALSILNNIPSLVAQNQLAITNANLKNTLFQLSSGSKINSGADDPAGLSISNGLQANISALTQSAQNVSNGVGMLQTADGALSQVTTLLNRAVTLATEAANTGLTTSQTAALQNEFTSINAEINQIGSNTTYNNNAVFSGTAMSVFLSDGSAADAADPNIQVAMPTLSASALGLASYATGTLDLTANPSAGNTVTIGTQTYTFEAQATAANQVALGSDVKATLQNLRDAVNGTGAAGIGTYGVGTQVNGSASITSINSGSAVVQALSAGADGNNVILATNLTSQVGAGGGTTLSNGANQIYNSARLTLAALPGTLSTAMGSITMTALPDTITNATGVLNLTAANPTAAINATGGLNLTAANPTGGNSTGTFTLTGQVTAGDTVTIGNQVYTFAANGGANAANKVALVTGNFQSTLDNLMAAVNSGGTGGSAATYGVGTAANGTARILSDGGGVAVVQSTAADATNSMALSQAVTGGAGAVSAVTGGAAADTITLGAATYTFVAAGLAAAANNQISIGVNQNTTLTNLLAALGGGAGSATTFHTIGNVANNAVTMTISGGGSGNTATFTATTTGVGGANTGNGTNYAVTGSIASGLTNNGGSAGKLGGGVNGDTVTIGGQTYSFVAQNEALQANYVAIGGTSASVTASEINTTLTHLMDAVNGTGGTAGANTFGTGSSAAGTATMYVAAGGTTTSATLTASAPGAAGNASVALTATGTISADVGPTGFLGGGMNADTLTIGGSTYTFVAAGQAMAANQIAIVNAAITANNTMQDNINNTLLNLEHAVNGSGGVAGNTTFGVGTNQNGTAMITGVANGVVSIEAAASSIATPGINGNTVQLSAANSTGTTTVSGSGFLSGGSAADTVTVGKVTYTFVAAGTAQAGQNNVALGADLLSTMNNLKAAVNSVSVSGGDASTYTLKDSTMLQGASGATMSVDVNGVATVQSLTATATPLTAVFGAGDSTGTVSGLTVQTLAGGSATGKASGMIDLAGGQPTVGNATGSVNVGTTFSALAGKSITIDGTAYNFVANGTANNAQDVSVGTTMATALTNLMNAVNGTGTAGASTYNGGTVRPNTTGTAVISSFDASTGTVNLAGTNLTTGGAVTLAVSAGFTKSGGTLSAVGTSDTIQIGAQTYTFVAAHAATSGNEVALGVASVNGGNATTAAQQTLLNLMAAVNATSTGTGAGAAKGTYNVAVVQDATAGASITSVEGDQAIVAANSTGAGGNSLALKGTFTSTSNVAGSPGGASAATAASGTFDLNAVPLDGNTVTIGSQTYTFTTAAPAAAYQVLIGPDAHSTLTNLAAAVNNTAGAGTTYGTGTAINAVATMTVSGNQATVTANSANLGVAGDNITLSANLANGVGGGTVGTIGSKLSGGGASVDLNSPIDAQTALTTIAAAIATVAGARGTIGSGINQMNAALQVMTNTSQNLTSSLSGIQDADIGKVVANMSKFQVLEQTGISALAQSNSQAQAVLKLLQ